MLTRRSSASLIVMGAGLAGFLTGCSVYDSSLLVSHKDAAVDSSADSSVDAPTDSSAETAREGGGDTALVDASDSTISDTADGDGSDEAGDLRYCDTCKDLSLYRLPCPAKFADSPSLKDALVFAARSVRMGTDPDKPDDWSNLGVDLDCLKTATTGEPMACKRATSASKSMMQDGLEGRDNSFALNVGGQMRMLTKAGMMVSPEQEMSTRFEEGKSSPVFRITDYNGTRNDPSVTFALFTATFPIDSKGIQVPAKWDGTDMWEISPTSVYGNVDKPRYYDDNAYVSDGVLVAHLQNGLQLVFAGGGSALIMQLNEPRFIATISTDLTELSNASLSAVWQREDALMNLSLFAGQKGMCPGSPQYMLISQMINSAVDVRLDLKPAPDKDCTAISIGMDFTASRAKVGTVGVTEAVEPSQCDAGP